MKNLIENGKQHPTDEQKYEGDHTVSEICQ